MRKKKILTILFFHLFIVSCVDQYWPDLDKYENLLVVDGLLTNNSKQIAVKLSRTSRVDSDILNPVTNGELYFTDDDEIITHLTETEPGTYLAVDSTFQGHIGKEYQLHIILSNGKKYISDVCKLPVPVLIDSVYGIVKKSNLPNTNELQGVQFYVENHNVSNDTIYYLWKMYQTYKYRSTFDIDIIWAGEFIFNPDATALRTCWITSKVNKFVLSSTKYFASNSVYTFPLNFVSNRTKALSIRYSLLVQQLTLSKSAFNFYDEIDQQNDAQGIMWSKQPVQILGNIHNIDDPDEPVLGYFIVAGNDEKRIFLNRPEIRFLYFECEPDFKGMKFIEYEPESMWPIYIDDIMFLGWARADYKYCFDCRLSGGSLTPPDFWE